jgi:hypothetical protein
MRLWHDSTSLEGAPGGARVDSGLGEATRTSHPRRPSVQPFLTAAAPPWLFSGLFVSLPPAISFAGAVRHPDPGFRVAVGGFAVPAQALLLVPQVVLAGLRDAGAFLGVAFGGERRCWRRPARPIAISEAMLPCRRGSDGVHVGSPVG